MNADRADVAAEQWRRERPELDTLPMEIMGRLAELTQRVSQEWINPFMESHGLQQGEFDVLATLRRAGAPHALTPTALYEATLVSSGGMTHRLDRLEKAGWIERRKHPSDRRAVLVCLTEAGFELVDGLMAQHVANGERLLSALTRGEQERLGRLLRKWLVGLG